jgi:hypothetical protein
LEEALRNRVVRNFIFLGAAALIGWTASAGYACNGGGGGGGSTSSGTAGTAALRANAALRSGSLDMSSPVSQQLALQRLAYQRMLQEQSQQLAAAQQQLTANQGNQPTTTRAEQVKQAREEKIAARKAREAALQAKRDELKAKNLAKRAATDATTQVASGQ